MKLTTITIFATAIVFSLASCGEKATTETVTTQAAESDYPLTTCVVSGEKLGSMGEPVVMEHNGTKVKLCCDECVDKFKGDADKYTKMVTDAK